MIDQLTAREATDHMFALVGRAITQWSFVEERLCGIFTVCTGVAHARTERGIEYLDSQVSNAVFYSVENFRGKLGLVDAAITTRLKTASNPSHPSIACWAALRAKTAKLSAKRNRLAHWTVLPAYEYEGVHAARLVPPYGSPGYWQETGLSTTGKTLLPQQVKHLEYAFYLLSEKLHRYAVDLAQQEALFEQYVELQGRLVRSLDQTAPNRAERLRRELSSLE